jgi:RNA polymerase sigma-70 factor (ECF subfamily)
MRTILERLTDGELVARVAGGDVEAFARLYDRHSHWLAARLSRRCGDAGLVDEAVQDTFLALWRGAAGYTGRGDVGAWLWGIAVRRLSDGLRRYPSPWSPLPAEGWASTEDPFAALIGDEVVEGLLAVLPETQRAVVHATIVDDLTMQQAADRLGIPVGTVKTRMMRARAGMRQVVEPAA